MRIKGEWVEFTKAEAAEILVTKQLGDEFLITGAGSWQAYVSDYRHPTHKFYKNDYVSPQRSVMHTYRRRLDKLTTDQRALVNGAGTEALHFL